MIEAKISCDRCDGVALVKQDRLGQENFVGLAVSALGQSIAMHLCELCYVAFAGFLKSNRDMLGKLTSHVSTVKCRAEARVPRDKTIQFTDRIGNAGAFAISRIVLDRPTDWRIEYVQIGNRNQLTNEHGEHLTPLPGSRFTEDDDGGDLEYETCQPRMDFVLVATYVGGNPEGGQLSFILHGRRHGFAPALTTPITGDPR